MRLRKPTFLAVVWIALCAILMAALAPSVSHMLAARADGGLPVCRAPAPMASLPGTNKADGASDMDDCGYCAMQGQLPILPSLPHNIAAVFDVLRFVPPLFLLAPRPLFVWLHARSRAPPAR